jgi:hypothetical protein
MPQKRKLTAQERSGVLAVLSVGCSRCTAARYIQCSPYILHREIAEHPKFAAQVAKAEEEAEVFYLTRIRSAAKKDQYWRAAAWVLERRCPKRYAAQKPEALTAEHVQQFLAHCIQIIAEELPNEEQRQRLIDRLTEELQENSEQPFPK